MNFIIPDNTLLWVRLMEATIAKGIAKKAPITVPNTDILIVSTKGPRTPLKKLQFGGTIRPKITKNC